MLLHIALKQAQDMNHFDGITYVFTVLANLAFERGDYMKAEKTYKDVMKRVMSKGIPAEDNSMIEMSLKLAKVYASWQQHDKAVLGFQFCINTQEKKVKNGDLDENTLALWGMSRDWFAQYLLDNGDYSGAFTEFQNAFLTSCELFGDSHPQSLVLINSLGTVASMMDDQARAVSYFQKAVKLASSEDDENLSTYLVNLGMARIKQSMQKEARIACTRAKVIAGQQKNPEVADEAQECLDLINKLGS
ncbi:tetratricopeptide repeat protein 19 homolog, mitochondrial-like [Tigriopus californicus]|nr:tetratricopeptide repeat protein 19 homolog, mitochondrial-like [Tigriopus californicus]